MKTSANLEVYSPLYIPWGIYIYTLRYTSEMLVQNSCMKINLKDQLGVGVVLNRIHEIVKSTKTWKEIEEKRISEVNHIKFFRYGHRSFIRAEGITAKSSHFATRMFLGGTGYLLTGSTAQWGGTLQVSSDKWVLTHQKNHPSRCTCRNDSQSEIGCSQLFPQNLSRIS